MEVPLDTPDSAATTSAPTATGLIVDPLHSDDVTGSKPLSGLGTGAPGYARHDNVATRDWSVQLAASLVDDGLHGLYDTEFLSRGVRAVRVQWILHNLELLRTCALLVYMALALFEQPTWCFRAECPTVPDSDIPKLPVDASLAVEAACLLAFLVADVFPKLLAKSVQRATWQGKLRALVTMYPWLFFKLAALFFSLADVFSSFGADSKIRVSALLRPCIFVSMVVSVRRVFAVVLRSVLSVGDIMLLILFLILYFSWLGLLLFQGNDERPYFGTYGRSVSAMQIALTTANFPDVMIPSYRANKLFFFLFAGFLLIGLYFLMPLTLATVYANYKSHLDDDRSAQQVARSKSLDAAFTVLDKAGSGRLPLSTVRALFLELNWYSNIAYVSETRAAEFLHKLDRDQSHTILKGEFQDLLTVLDSKQLRPPWYAQPEHASSRLGMVWRAVSQVVLHPWFEPFVDVCIASNVVITAVESSLVINNDNQGDAFNQAEAFFLVFYSCEGLLKVFVLGWGPYWKGARNRFDFSFLVLTLAFELWLLLPNSFSSNNVVRYLVLLRSLRLVRLLAHFRRFEVVLLTYGAMLPKFGALLGLMCAVFYFFAEVGMSAFGGQITDPPPAVLQGSSYITAGYTALNFNDFGSSVVTLFVLLVVNNWFVFQEAFVLLTGDGARVFFLSFYFVQVILVLNVVIAFMLDTFSTEFDAAKQRAGRHQQQTDNDDRKELQPTSATGTSRQRPPQMERENSIVRVFQPGDIAEAAD